jgi:hypothetical protein
MYIRTECGRIGTLENNFTVMHDRNYVQLTKSLGVSKFKIKSSGDNLIDVLDLDDIIEFNDPRYTNEVYRIISFITSIGNNFDGVKFIDTNDEYSFNEIHLLSLNVKVITHEQYMKLAQEIK